MAVSRGRGKAGADGYRRTESPHAACTPKLGFERNGTLDVRGIEHVLYAVGVSGHTPNIID